MSRPVRNLLSPLLLQGRNLMRAHPRGAVALLVTSGALLLGLQRLAEWFLWNISEVAIGQILAHHLMSMFLFSLQFMLAFSAVINALSAFFLSHDLEVWQTSPAKPGAVFWAKLIETTVTSSWMVVLLLVPVLYAYGNVFAAPPQFFLVALALPLPYASMVSAAGVILALGIARVLPVRRTRELMRFFSVLGIATLVVIFRVLQPERLTEQGGFDKMAGYLTQLHPDHLEYFPSFWLTELAHAFMRWDFEFLFTEYLMKYLGAWLLMLAMARGAFALWYRQGLYKFREAPPPPPQEPGVIARFLTAPLAWLPMDLQQLIAKDIRVLARSPVVWTQLSLMAVIVLIYFYNLYLLPMAELETLQPGLSLTVAFANCAFIGFLLVAAALRFGFPTISIEGEMFLVLHTSPLGMRRYLQGKFLLNLVPLAGMGLTLAGLAHWLLSPTWPMLLLGYADSIALSVAIAAMALDFGAQFRNLRATNFAHLPSGPGGIAFLVASMGFVLAVVGLQAYPFWIYRKVHYMGGVAGAPPWGLCAGLLAFSFVLAGVVTIGCLRRAQRSLEGGLE